MRAREETTRGATSCRPPYGVNWDSHLVIATGGNDLIAVCLHPLGLRELNDAHAAMVGNGAALVTLDAPLGFGSLNLRELRRQAIAEAMVRAGGVRARAAEMLGVSKRALFGWLREEDGAVEMDSGVGDD